MKFEFVLVVVVVVVFVFAPPTTTTTTRSYVTITYNLPAITDRSNRSAGSGAPTKSANVCTDSIVVAVLLQASPNSIDYTQIEVTGRRRRLLFIVAILFCRRAVDLCCTTTTTINIRDRLVNGFVFFLFYLLWENVCNLIYFGSAHRHEQEGIIFQRCAFCRPPAPSSASVRRIVVVLTEEEEGSTHERHTTRRWRQWWDDDDDFVDCGAVRSLQSGNICVDYVQWWHLWTVFDNTFHYVRLFVHFYLANRWRHVIFF